MQSFRLDFGLSSVYEGRGAVVVGDLVGMLVLVLVAAATVSGGASSVVVMAVALVGVVGLVELPV